MLPTPAAIQLPFLYGSRRRIERIESAKAFDLDGGVTTFEVDPAGYSAGFLVRISGILTVSNAALVFKGAGIWDYLRRIIVDTPGQVDPLELSGDQLHLQNLLSRDIVTERPTVMAPSDPTALDSNTYYDANVAGAFTNAVGAQAFRLNYFVPMRRNARDERGLRGLGRGATKTTLRLTPSTEADFVTVPANVSSAVTVEVYHVFYDRAPAADVRPPDDNWAITFEQFETAVTATGSSPRIEVDPEGVILNICNRVILNDAPNLANLDHVSLLLDRRKLYDEIPLWAWLWMQNHERPAKLPIGVIAYDFDRHQADPEPVDPNLGGHARGREWLFADELDSIKPKIQIGAGATLGTVAKVITSVKRLVFVG